MLIKVIMGSIKPRNYSFYISLFLLLIAHCSLLSAQSFGPVGSLASEIERLDALIQDPNIGSKAKGEALSAKAQLLEMSGNIEEAAQTWNEAAFAEAGKRDDKALLRSAACFAAMGEYSKADAALKIILLTGSDAAALKDARFLAAQTEVFRNGEISFPILLAFLDNPDYSSYKANIYYLLWHISGSENYKTRLIAESPEALLAENENAGIIPALTPMWLLFPGREQIVFSHPTVNLPTEAPASVNPNANTTVGHNPEDVPPVLIQVGLYSRHENAEAMVSRLRARGFTGTISQKTVSGTSYWQVSVPPGQNANQTIMILKDAGFESFPVFN